MELPIKQLKLVRYKKYFPDLSKKDFYALKESLAKWGIIEPIVINQDNIIICGKERYRAALLLGMEKVPVVIRRTNRNSEIENISLEENLKRRRLPPYKEAKEVTALYELKSVKGKEERRRKKGNNAMSRKSITKQMNVSEKHISRYHTAKLIPELSKLLDGGKINQEAALLYATLPFENQKKVYAILMDNFSNDKFMKRDDHLKGIGEGAEDEETIEQSAISSHKSLPRLNIVSENIIKRGRTKKMPTTIRNKTLYSVAELSQKMNVTPVTIWKYLKQGKLKGQKTMGKWFISDEEIVEFFNEIQLEKKL